MTTAPDFRAELEKLVDLYKALGGNWSPHGYTDTWNDALASARTALATPPPAPPTDEELLPSCFQYEQLMQGLSHCFSNTSAHDYLKVWIRDYTRAAIERWGHG